MRRPHLSSKTRRLQRTWRSCDGARVSWVWFVGVYTGAVRLDRELGRQAAGVELPTGRRDRKKERLGWLTHSRAVK